jgi:hypothetical protein
LLDQAARCLEHDDEVGAEVHLTAALEVSRAHGDRAHQAQALLALGRLRIRQRRHAAAARLIDEAASLGAKGAELDEVRAALRR